VRPAAHLAENFHLPAASASVKANVGISIPGFDRNIQAISCGVYGYPPKEAARNAVAVCTRPEYETVMKYLYLSSNDMAAIWAAALEDHCST
jgi:hypothetical protein